MQIHLIAFDLLVHSLNSVDSIIYIFDLLSEWFFFVSDLEREIYELSSLLSDQRVLIESLMQMSGEDRSSICTSSSLHTSNAATNPINILMQKMDGIAVRYFIG